MNFLFLAKGIIIGFSIAAPVGPIGVLCIRRSLTGGRLQGFVSGLGAATADAVYGMIAAFGITMVSNLLLEGQLWLKITGGLFLCWLGVRTFMKRRVEENLQESGKNLTASYVSTFLLTLTNPMTILSFAAVFAGLGIGGASNSFEAVSMVLGVFIGSASWWLILSTGVGMLRNKLDPGKILWVNRASGLIITIFGLLSLQASLTNFTIK